MLPRLEKLGVFVQTQLGKALDYRAYVDTGPLLERSFAEQAGLGFVGKNTCLIHPKFGSWLFLGELMLSEEIVPDREVLPSRCGKCARCLEACPTGALEAPYRLNARRCISYLTIELKGPIPRELRSGIGNHIFGCDVCQQVCPWQRFSQQTGEPTFQCSSTERVVPALVDLLEIDEGGFQRRYLDSPIMRLGRSGLLRNAAIALGNTGESSTVPVLGRSLGDKSPLVRGHAAWALGRIGGSEAIAALRAVVETETDTGVQQELTAALEEVVA
jgi:epoxyqueuosine reductase